MIDLDQLDAFIAISERGTVTAAARKLHRTQSAISRRLALLEDALGAQLFDRRGAKLALSDCGRAFLPFAESALAALVSGREAVQQQLAPDAGSVSIAIVGPLVETPLAAALRALPRASSKLSVLTASSAEVSRLVRRGDANLGVRYFEDEDTELAYVRLGTERMCVVGAPDHGPPRKRERWIGFPTTRTAKDDLGRLLAQQLAAAGLRSPEVMVVDSLSAQKRLVEVGLGIALLPESSVREELARGTLVRLDVPRVATTIDIHLVHRHAGYLSPAARAVIALLRRAFTAKPTPKR
ncbi:MAG TPA: LysR family transcriptional regulator [Polyangiales bacterium]|nr:LysR family transcriptional regulator [Polyangiales bacterium]